MSSIERITEELKGLDYIPFRRETPQGEAVFIEYYVQTGKYEGKKVLLGFSFQEEGYPEYPPHWIHISPPYDDQRGGSTQIHSFSDDQNIKHKCLALSRPPGELWDKLLTKNMKNYLDFHITGFCNQLK